MVRKEGLWNPFANNRDRKFSRDRGASKTEEEERDWARERITRETVEEESKETEKTGLKLSFG